MYEIIYRAIYVAVGYTAIVCLWLLIGLVVFGFIQLWMESDSFPHEHELTVMRIFRKWQYVLYIITFQVSEW